MQMHEKSEKFTAKELSLGFTCHSRRARLGEEVDDVALLDAAVGEVHLEPETVSGARLEVHNERSGCGVALRDLEHTRVLLAAVALVDCTEDVDVFVLRIRNSAPAHLDARRLDFRDIQHHLEAVSVDSLVRGDFQSLADTELGSMSVERNVEDSHLVGRLGFQVVESVGSQSSGE